MTVTPFQLALRVQGGIYHKNKLKRINININNVACYKLILHCVGNCITSYYILVLTFFMLKVNTVNLECLGKVLRKLGSQEYVK